MFGDPSERIEQNVSTSTGEEHVVCLTSFNTHNIDWLPYGSGGGGGVIS